MVGLGVGLEPHHIIYRSEVSVPELESLDDPQNGISLCAVCHRIVHQGAMHKGAWYGAREIMIVILERLNEATCGFRWYAVLQILKRGER